MRTNWKLMILGTVILGEILCVLAYAEKMRPIKNGAVANFWIRACGVKLRNVDEGDFDGIYPPRDGWYIYYKQLYHGQLLYRVPREEAAARYGEVLEDIKSANGNHEATPHSKVVHEMLKGRFAEVENDPDKFLALIRNETLSRVREKSEDAYQLLKWEERVFEQRWTRNNRYWINIVLECAFLAVLTLFLFWPWLRGKTVWSWCAHAGAAPLLLFIPYYFGYCGWTFTSVGPSGGVLYPWIIHWFRDFPIWTPVDGWLLTTLPKWLEPLSHPLGPMIAITGFRPLGPVAAIVLGAAIAAAIWGIFHVATTHKSPAIYKRG